VGDPGDGEYVLGSKPEELERLEDQGRTLAPATRLILSAAGLGPGMRVLDLGSGVGDVAFVAAELVGPGGEVIGIDRSHEAAAKANMRAQQRDLANVQFVVGDIYEAATTGPVDAIVGRLVLMHVPDPVAVLRAQSALLRPGGKVIPIEIDIDSARSLPPTFLVGQVASWLTEAYQRAGIHTSLG
jgi:ubiquinone/menaquinone biosynthesis C-methylase UbiE